MSPIRLYRQLVCMRRVFQLGAPHALYVSLYLMGAFLILQLEAPYALYVSSYLTGVFEFYLQGVSYDITSHNLLTKYCSVLLTARNFRSW